MLDAGGDINHRNRFGCTASQDIVEIYQFDPASKAKASEALKWFLAHGGSPDIEDGDGISAKYLVRRLAPMVPNLVAILNEANQQNSVGSVSGQKPAQKTGRNNPCPCGSSRKFKKCCGKDSS